MLYNKATYINYRNREYKFIFKMGGKVTLLGLRYNILLSKLFINLQHAVKTQNKVI